MQTRVTTSADMLRHTTRVVNNAFRFLTQRCGEIQHLFLVIAASHSTWVAPFGFGILRFLQLVIDESGAGATSAARERLELIEALPLLDATLETDQLAAALIAAKAIPETEPRDAFHISIAATNGVKYLLTWNFKHIANATLRKRIESVCRNAGFEPPTICTPDELMGLTDDT